MTEPIVIDPSDIKENRWIVYFILIFILLWVVLGFVAFIYSLICFKYESSMIEKLIGLLLAIFTGPLYFIYYNFNSNYCKNTSRNNAPRTNTIPRYNAPRTNTIPPVANSVPRRNRTNQLIV